MEVVINFNAFLCFQLKKPEWKPDFGPDEFVPSWGATAVGARKFLIAYNVNILATKNQAHRIALIIRESGKGSGDQVYMGLWVYSHVSCACTYVHECSGSNRVSAAVSTVFVGVQNGLSFLTVFAACPLEELQSGWLVLGGGGAGSGLHQSDRL